MKNGVRIVRFVQWQCHGTGDLTGYSDSGSRWDGRGVEEFPVDGDEAALRLSQVVPGPHGSIKRQLQDLDPRAVFLPSGRQDFSAEDRWLTLKGVRRSLDLEEGERLSVLRLLRRGATCEHDEQSHEREQRTCWEPGPRLPQ